MQHTLGPSVRLRLLLLLMGAVALPCTAQVIEDQVFGHGGPPAQPHRARCPVPTGPYEVGRTEFDWVDKSRPDPDSPSGHREIVVWLWYPASPKNGAEPAELMPGKWGELLLPYYLSKRKWSGTTLSEFEAGLKEYPISTIGTQCLSECSHSPW